MTFKMSDISSKRKQNFGDRKNKKRLRIKALDGTEVYLGSRSSQLSETFEVQSAFGRKDETHSQRPDNSDAGQDSGFVASLATSPTTPTTLEKACSPRQAPTEDNPSPERDVAFAVLPAHLRAKAEMIGDIATRGAAWHFFNYIESWFSVPTNSSNAEPNPDDDVPLTSLSDQRLRELKVGILIQQKTEKSLKSMKIVARVFKRVYLAELAGKYKAETAARKAESKSRRKKNLATLSVKNRYTDVLFPESIMCEDRHQSKEKGKRLSKKENCPRKKAKGKLEYWLKSGKLLAMMVQRFGVGIILLLPKKLTDKNLYSFPRHLFEPFLDYIDFLHPGLREHISNLSALLPGIVENGLPSKRIVLETYNSDQLLELCNRPLKDLFQFCAGIDSQRACAMAGPPLSQDPSNTTYSEYPRPPAPQRGVNHPLTINQQVGIAVEEPFCSRNGDSPVKPLGHYEGEPVYVDTTGDMPTSANHTPGPGVPQTLADEARRSLDDEVDKLRVDGILEAGKATMERLKWTDVTLKAARDFEKIADFAPPKTLGFPDLPTHAKGNIKWTGPIVYSDVLADPLKYYSSSIPEYGILGILALGSLVLPEIGGSSMEIESGTVAYFRVSDPVTYRSCGGGRGILFYITIKRHT
ncbi:hypothetical protein V492_05415 [Pseudogymnoascus sp. VKM F-4246]|nr:hypothetical protein V492_05415 [Pseudogymnoascus sp. VKM F-4246]